MNNVLEDSLFVSQNKKFDEIQSIVRQFSAEYVGNSIIKDNIFAVIQNYARKKEIALEMLRYPIHDDELWALTFLKQDTIFVCVNGSDALDHKLHVGNVQILLTALFDVILLR